MDMIRLYLVITLCMSGFHGSNGAVQTDACQSNKCQNGATCKQQASDRHDLYTCQCTPQYTGQYCQLDVDECTQHTISPCQNGGTCSNYRGGYLCICVNGWKGKNCDVNIDDCARQPCQNGGTCHDRAGYFYCECPPSKTGLLCQLEDACQSSPCNPLASCETSPIDGSYVCTCPAGWTGPDCKEDVNECATTVRSPCEFGGTCVNTPGSFRCACAPGFTSSRCEVDVNECASNPCFNDGSCLDDRGRFTCLCDTGYRGVRCEVKVEVCASSPCLNGATCRDLIGRFECDCLPGFTGSRCELTVDECASQPCLNGATCQDDINGFTCTCPTGYTGLRCEVDIDDCAGVDCHSGLCMDQVGGYTCRCADGFVGSLCEVELDECSSSPCLFEGTCVDYVASYQCLCPLGTSGKNCEYNTDDCASQPCLNGAQCQDKVNGYQCSCLPGYTGTRCQVDIDECASSPCQHGGTCNNLVNGFKCTCTEGYYDHMCVSDINECASDPCLNGGQCVDGIHRYDCECARGYEGQRCGSEVNECASNPCQHGATCTDLHGNYTCSCAPGYTGSNCEVIVDMCQPNLCGNHGTCLSLVNDFHCLCDLPYSGRKCDVIMNPCQPTNPCSHGSTCVPEANYVDFTCVCFHGYEGRLCERDIDECEANEPCFNGGVCQNVAGTYNCDCAAGFVGQHCEVNYNECQSDPCRNGALCIDAVDGFTCSCPGGFAGDYCQHDIDECLSSPCVNGATCHDHVNSYTCQCAPGFNGLTCHINDNDCSPSTCLFGGTCVDGISSYSCFCAPGYTGTNCQRLISACDSRPCLNSAKCISHDNYHFTCQCQPGFTGQLCDQYVDKCSVNDNPCQNGATCHQGSVANGFRCTCTEGWSGATCDMPEVSCQQAANDKGVSVSELCQNGGRCINNSNDVNQGHKCLCGRGYGGSYCDLDIDECASSPCRHGATCRNEVGRYSCICPPGYQGLDCEQDVDDCAASPCQHGGTCHDLVNNFRCSCPPGTKGLLCEVNENDCKLNACQNGGSCRDAIGGFECTCPPGFTGYYCEADINECKSNPCTGLGVSHCVQSVNSYACICRQGWTGLNCDFGNETALTSSLWPNNNSSSLDQLDDARPSPCELNQCHLKTGNGRCDEECNTYSCQYDGLECSYQSSPYANCSAVQQGIACWEVFQDGKCDQACSSMDCLFDGFDCSAPLNQCDALYTNYCSAYYADGHCDEGCNNAECGWDGLDCDLEATPPLDDYVVIVLLIDVQEFNERRVDFLRTLGHVLHSVVTVARDASGASMIYQWSGSSDSSSTSNSTRVKRAALAGTEVTLDVVSDKCPDDQCMSSASIAAQFIAECKRQDKCANDYPIYSVTVKPRPGLKTAHPWHVTVSVVCCLTIVSVLSGVLVTVTKRKRAITWYPDGCQLRTVSGISMLSESCSTSLAATSQAEPSVSVTTDELDDWADSQKAKKAKCELGDSNEGEDDDCDWSASHLVSTNRNSGCGVPGESGRSLLTEHKRRSVDCHGPCGLTPLMLAACAGSSCRGDHNVKAVTVETLVALGADVNAQSDVSGETPLHYAARYCRADSAQPLIDGGALVNVKADDGRTPLLAAVAADAEDVVRMLLKCPGVDVNAKDDGGSTALIIAARLAIRGVVHQLIDAGADLNAVDDMGRTALHWAATVNNCEMLCALLSHGADMDVQDQRDMTPLLLAAREGCRDAVAILLNSGADRHIADDKGRVARDIALERCHRDLVHFIDNFVPSVASQSDMLRGLPSTSHVQKSTTCAATATARKPRPKPRTSSLGREKQVQSLDIANLVKVKVKAEDFTSQNQHQNHRNLLNPLHQHPVTLDFSPTLSPIGSFELPPSYESACTSCVTLQHAAQSIDNSCGSNGSNSMQFGNRFFPSCPSHTPVVSLGLDQAAGRRSVPSVGLASTSNSCAQSPDVLSPLSGVTGNSPQSSNCCTTDNYLQQQLQHPFSLSASASHLSTQTASFPLSALALSHHSRDGLQQLPNVHERAISTHNNTNLCSSLLTNHCSQPSVAGLFDNHSDNQSASIAGIFQLRDQVSCPVRPHMSTFLQPSSSSATGNKKVMTLPLPAAQYQCASQQQQHQWDDTSDTRWPLFPSPPLQSQQQLLQYNSYPVQQPGSTTYAALLDSCTIPLLTPSPESTVSEHWSSSLPDSPPEQQWLSDNMSSSPVTSNSQCRLLRY